MAGYERPEIQAAIDRIRDNDLRLMVLMLPVALLLTALISGTAWLFGTVPDFLALPYGFALGYCAIKTTAIMMRSIRRVRGEFGSWQSEAALITDELEHVLKDQPRQTPIGPIERFSPLMDEQSRERLKKSVEKNKGSPLPF